MANEITSTTIGTTDQEKYLVAKLLANATLRMVASSVCDKVSQPKGSGKTANFVKYARMNIPVTALSEGVDPQNNTFSPSTISVTLDQWGDVLTLTDLAVITTSHPLVSIATELLADNAQRVIDREVQIVWLAGTNVQYGDSSVTARPSVSAMKITDTIIHRARITLADAGAPPRGGPSKDYIVASADSGGTLTQGMAYVGIAGVQVMGDIMQAGTSLGTWAAVAMYANQKALYAAEVGTWLGIRWVETNFIPKFARLGNNTTAVASGAAFGTGTTPVVTVVATGGTLTHDAVYGFKVTRKSLQRGFEEDISLNHTITMGATVDTQSVTFNFGSLTSGYVYNLYFDSVAAGGSTTDNLLTLVQANITVGTTVTVTANPSGTASAAPAHTANGVTVYPVYIHGAESCNWVGLQDLQVLTSGDGATTSNPLSLRRTIGYKFMAKTMIRDQTRMLRLEVTSTY